MFIVVSPAKKLDFEHESPHSEFTKGLFESKSKDLIKELKKL